MKKRTKTRLATLESKIRWLQYVIEFNNLKEPEMSDVVSGITPTETPFQQTRLPDGSGFCIVNFPLPEDHWIYEKGKDGFQPRMPKELKLHPSCRGNLEPLLKAALKTAIRGATNGGKEMDFDPDALVMNFFAALFNPED